MQQRPRVRPDGWLGSWSLQVTVFLDACWQVPRAKDASGPRGLPGQSAWKEAVNLLSERTFPQMPRRGQLIIIVLGLISLGITAISGDAFVSPLQGRQAPELARTTWINSDPLKLQDLRGKVVLLEFWTYG